MSAVLSVVVPAYNVAAYLPACLDSLLGQSLRELEVIVVDDGSPDECGEIADAYAARDPRVTVLHTENQGLGPARNTGAAAAPGRYLAFVDSDDIVPEDAYELLVGTLEETGSDLAAGNALRLFPDGSLEPSWTHQEAFASDRLKTSIREFPLLVRDRMAWNKVWRRSFWDAQGFEFPAIRYEDFPVTLASHLRARAVDVLSANVYQWRQREASTSITQQSADLGNARDRVRSAELVLELAEAEADAQVLKGLHSYLVDVDVVAVAHAYAVAGPDTEAELASILVSFARRLRPVGTKPPSRTLHAAARRGALGAVRALALSRGKGRVAQLRALLRPDALPLLPGVAAAGVSRLARRRRP